MSVDQRAKPSPAAVPQEVRELLLRRGSLQPPVIYHGEKSESTRVSRALADGWKDGYEAALADIMSLGLLSDVGKQGGAPAE